MLILFWATSQFLEDIEDRKFEEIPEEDICKTRDILDEKFAKFEHSFRNDIVNLRNNLNSVKKLNKK